MKIYDVSMEIHPNMQVYKMKEEKKPKFISNANYEKNGYFESSLEMDCHTGTHVDAPLHQVEGGRDLSYLDLDKLIRKVKVLDFTNIDEKIEKEDLVEKNITKGDFVLLKTKNSYDETFKQNYIYLGLSGSQYLADIGVDGVGVDSLSVGSGTLNKSIHTSLMEKEIIIIEGLRLMDVVENNYNMIALPLKIKTLEGAPMRVVLTD